MGLDQYLNKSRYLSEYNEEDKVIIDSLGDLLGDTKINILEGTCLQWRKSNQIHKWFVDNYQDGVDECQKTHIPYSSLQELHKLVVEVLEDHSKAEDLLPNEAGFFFGSQDYDEYYFDDLERTREGLDKLFKEDPEDIPNEVYSKCTYTYQASW